VRIEVVAGAVARTFAVVPASTVRTIAIRGSAGTVPVHGPEVAVTVSGRRLEDGDDLRLAGTPEQSPDGGRLAWRLASTDGDVTVDVEIEADRHAGVVRKRVAVSGTGRLERVELELWDGVAVDGFTSVNPGPPPNTGSLELGQPVFGPGFFGGIEHPGAENLATPGGCRCALPYDDALAVDRAAPIVTPAAVVGTGDFFDYLDTIRPHPARVVVLVNNWYHLGWPGTMAEDTVVAELEGFAGVAARHGVELDAYCLDDGWDGAWEAATGLWGRLELSAFPGGLPALQAAGGARRIGLWIGPFGGYGDRQVARVTWAGQQGCEIERFDPPGYDLLCVAGDRYGNELARTLAGWTAAGVGYWKLDGLRFACAQPGHGHPTGPGGRTAQMDRFAGVMAAARAADPAVVVAFTTGSNPSPWWLRTADYLWRGGLDDSGAGFPGPRHESFATYIDARLHLLRPCAVPVSAIVTFSVVESDACRYRDVGESIEDWERHCWLIVGRGTQHHDLYVSPGSLSEDEWAALARALAWARRHRRTLARSRMVLGDPGKGQVYGYASGRGGGSEGILCLRNPTPRRRRVRFTLAEVFGFPPETELEIDPVHGPRPSTTPSTTSNTSLTNAARRLTVTLDPFAVSLFRCARPGTATPPAPPAG
jgi:hypothetical protein